MSSRHPWTNRIGALALGLGLAMTFVIGPCWWTIFRYHNPICSQYKPDFVSLYTGAVLISANVAALYDLEQQRIVQAPIDPSRGDKVLPFFYPPFFALFLAPLGALSFSAAFALMTLFNLILLALALRLLIRHLGLNRRQSLWLMLATFCGYGVHYALLEGQTSFIALTLLVLMVSGLNNNARAAPGIWLGLMFFKPQLTLIPLILLITTRKWFAVVTALGVLGGLAVLSLWILGGEGLVNYLSAARQAWTADSFLQIMRPEQPERMHNLRALAYYFVTVHWRDYVWAALALAVIGVVAIECLERKCLGPSSWFKILVSVILVSPHLHDHDMALFVAPAAFLLKFGGDDVPSWVAAALVGVGFLPLLNTLAFPHLPPLVPLAGLVYLLAAAGRG